MNRYLINYGYYSRNVWEFECKSRIWSLFGSNLVTNLGFIQRAVSRIYCFLNAISILKYFMFYSINTNKFVYFITQIENFPSNRWMRLKCEYLEANQIQYWTKYLEYRSKLKLNTIWLIRYFLSFDGLLHKNSWSMPLFSKSSFFLQCHCESN